MGIQETTTPAMTPSTTTMTAQPDAQPRAVGLHLDLILLLSRNRFGTSKKRRQLCKGIKWMKAVEKSKNERERVRTKEKK
jgi:hypothetical protein